MHFLVVTMWRRIRIFINVMPSKPYLGTKRWCTVGRNNGSRTPNNPLGERKQEIHGTI